jgi:hypothetical protein
MPFEERNNLGGNFMALSMPCVAASTPEASPIAGHARHSPENSRATAPNFVKSQISDRISPATANTPTCG